MSSASEEFKHELIQEPAAVVRYLRALADGLESGRLAFRAGDQELAVTPNGLINLAIKAEREGRKVRVSARLAWKEQDLEAQNNKKAEPQDLIIESGSASR